jgi:hypothetical protein
MMQASPTKGVLIMTNDITTGRAKGGMARAQSLTEERRKEIARKAATARWGFKSTYKGNFREDFGVDVDCYVLEDAAKTAVISQTGMAMVLGLSPRGNALPRFLENKIMAEAVGAELRQKTENPIIFQYISRGAGPITVHGFDSSVLIDICNAIISAEAKLGERYSHIVKQAHLINAASAKLGIRGLVYALAGYNPKAQEFIDAFKAYILDEAKKYEREFPNELYLEWYRLYDLDVPDRGMPWKFRHLTVNHIYYPLANSQGKLLSLLKAQKARGGDREKKLFQFLNDVGARALRMQLGRVLEMAESSTNKQAYEAKIRERFGDQKELGLTLPASAASS